MADEPVSLISTGSQSTVSTMPITESFRVAQNRPVQPITRRAVIIGGMCVAAVAVMAPLNDWGANSTYLYGGHLPLIAVLLLLLVNTVLNPLLGARRLLMNEQVVILSMLLVLGGVVSNGLMRVFPAVLAGPAHVIPSNPQMAAYSPNDGVAPPLSPSLFLGIPERGPISTVDPEYRLVIDGFFNGMARGEPSVEHRSHVRWHDDDGDHHAIAVAGSTARVYGSRPGYLDLASPLGRALAGCRAGNKVNGPSGALTVTAVSAPGIPWYAWAKPALHWLPLLIGGFLCSLALAALVRTQWITNERLPFPIAKVMLAFLEPARDHHAWSDLYRNRGFWIAFLVPTIVLTSQGLMTWNVIPLAIPTEFNFRPAFAGEPWWHVWDHSNLFDVHIYFSVVALAFFLTLDVSFSMWFFFVLTNLVVMELRGWGVPVAYDHPMIAGVGGYAVECLFILWIGRHYYGRLLTAVIFRSTDPEVRTAAPWIWVLLLAAGMMVLWLMAAGAQFFASFLTVLLFLGFILVLARLVAEAGVPLIGLPNPMTMNQTVFSLIGVQAPLSALAPLSAIGSTLLAEQRDLLLPHTLHGQYLADRSGLNKRGPRLPIILMSVLVCGGAIAFTTMIWRAYSGSGNTDWYWNLNLIDFGLAPLANDWQNAGATDEASGAGLCYGIGAVVVFALGAGRLLVPGWPLHPLGYIASMPWPTRLIWFSFFLGWLVKFLVMRYGGPGLYKRLHPVALGLIAGEASTAGLFVLIQTILRLTGHESGQTPSFLPH